MKVIFDCDGVLFDSNSLKVDAFSRVLSRRFDAAVVEEFLTEHRRSGGVSRYVKFERLAVRVAPEVERRSLVLALLDEFSRACLELYDAAPMTDGALECLDWLMPRAHCFVASGSDQEELRAAFERRGLSRYFSGIFGSPTPKEELVGAILRREPRTERALFVGDAVKDYEAAAAHEVPCVVMRTYSDAPAELDRLAEVHQLKKIASLRELPRLIESGEVFC